MFTNTRQVILDAYAFDAAAVRIHDWLIALLVGHGAPDVLPCLSRAEGAVLRLCLQEHAAAPGAWLEAWDGLQEALYG